VCLLCFPFVLYFLCPWPLGPVFFPMPPPICELFNPFLLCPFTPFHRRGLSFPLPILFLGYPIKSPFELVFHLCSSFFRLFSFLPVFRFLLLFPKYFTLSFLFQWSLLYSFLFTPHFFLVLYLFSLSGLTFLPTGHLVSLLIAILPIFCDFCFWFFRVLRIIGFPDFPF